MRLASLILLVAAACGEGTVVEVDPVPADYTDWYRVDAVGSVPGHGDTYRIIYANDTARLRGVPVLNDKGTPDPDDDVYTPRTWYPEGTIIVKEIHERDGDQPGGLKYIGVMRRLVEAPSGAELQSDDEFQDSAWLFTYLAEDINSDEEYRSSCWDECHAAAPIDGAFLDYGQ